MNRLKRIVLCAGVAVAGVFPAATAQTPSGSPAASASPSPSPTGAQLLTMVYQRDEPGRVGGGIVGPDQPQGPLFADLGQELEAPIWTPDGTGVVFWFDPTSVEELRPLQGGDYQQVTVGCTAPTCVYESAASFSPNGELLAAERIAGDGAVPTSSGIAISELATGKVHLITSIDWTRGEDRWPRWSPDGTTIVFARMEVDAAGNETGSGVWAIDVDGSHLRRLTPVDKTFADPDWSPDGKTIVLDDGRVGYHQDTQLFTMRPDGSDLAPLAVSVDTSGEAITGVGGPRWTPDGKSIVFSAIHASGAELWAVPSTGGAAVRLTQPEPGVWHTPSGISARSGSGQVAMGS